MASHNKEAAAGQIRVPEMMSVMQKKLEFPREELIKNPEEGQDIGINHAALLSHEALSTKVLGAKAVPPKDLPSKAVSNGQRSRNATKEQPSDTSSGCKQGDKIPNGSKGRLINPPTTQTPEISKVGKETAVSALVRKMEELQNHCRNLQEQMIADADAISKQKLEDSRTECKALQGQVVSLKQNLQEAQDFIFTLQPRQQKFTEREAADEFKSLCDSVEEFVGRKLGDALYEKAVIKENKMIYLQPAELLLSLIPSFGKRAFELDGTDEHNVIAAIFQFLRHEVFEAKYLNYVGDSKIASFMESVEGGMRILEPDLITFHTWRSETFRALAARPEFEKIRWKRTELITVKLAQMLAILLPRTVQFKDLLQPVYDSIIKPALTLSHKMMYFSVDEFIIEQSENYYFNPERQKHMVDGFNQAEFVNVETCGKVKQPPAGDMRYILDITPQLIYRCVKATSYGERKVLKKPKVLVKVINPVQKPLCDSVMKDTQDFSIDDLPKEDQKSNDTVMEDFETLCGESKVPVPAPDATVLGWMARMMRIYKEQNKAMNAKQGRSWNPWGT